MPEAQGRETTYCPAWVHPLHKIPAGPHLQTDTTYTHPFIYRHFLRAYYVPGAGLAAGNDSSGNTEKVSTLMELSSLTGWEVMGEADHKQRIPRKTISPSHYNNGKCFQGLQGILGRITGCVCMGKGGSAGKQGGETLKKMKRVQ